VDAKVFLGEFIDFQVKLGERSLMARVHPSLKTLVGEPLHVRINPEKCICISQD
jgi:iron(III) transport system ATP-binding protein